MEIVLRNVTTDDLYFLYEMLKERPAIASISHKVVPTFEEHCLFVNSRPYKKWYIIWHVRSDEGTPSGMVPVGNIYLTDRYEIGIFVRPEWQGCGIGTMAIRMLMAEDPGARYLANIATGNAKSKNLFCTVLGFRLIQETYVKEEK